MAEHENLDIPTIVTAGIVSVALVLASVFGVQALYLAQQSQELDRKSTSRPTTRADSKLAEQDAKLARYAWADRASGRVVLPIERAMILTAREYAEGTE